MASYRMKTFWVRPLRCMTHDGDDQIAAPDLLWKASAMLLRSGPMTRVVRIRLWHVPLTSHTSYRMADGKTCDTVESVVLALDTDTGQTGWGEVCPIPGYLPAYARGVAPAVTEFAPVLFETELTGPEAAPARLREHLPGHHYAHSAADIALWDIFGQFAGLPVHALLGGLRQREFPLYHSISCLDPEEMASIAARAARDGIAQFQVKLGREGDWELDVARLARVRETVGSGPLVYGDWNCGATSLDATRVGHAVAHLDIMLEQPCRTIAECARVRDATGLPMKLDEAAHDTGSLLDGAAMGCMDAVAIKTSKFGGLSLARRARDLCEHLGVKMCIEDTWGSDIAMAAALHLAASTDPRYVMNVCDLSSYVGPRIAPYGPSRNNGRITVPEGPGLGISPDTGILGTPDMVLEG